MPKKQVRALKQTVPVLVPCLRLHARSGRRLAPADQPWPVLDRDEGGVAHACIGALLDSLRCIWMLKDKTRWDVQTSEACTVRAPSSIPPATLALSSRIQHLYPCEWRLPSWTIATTVHEGPGLALARVDHHSLNPGLCCLLLCGWYGKLCQVFPAPLVLLGRAHLFLGHDQAGCSCTEYKKLGIVRGN